MIMYKCDNLKCEKLIENISDVAIIKCKINNKTHSLHICKECVSSGRAIVPRICEQEDEYNIENNSDKLALTEKKVIKDKKEKPKKSGQTKKEKVNSNNKSKETKKKVNKSNVRRSLRTKLIEYGIDKIVTEYRSSDNKTDKSKELAKRFNVSVNTLRTLFSSYGISDNNISIEEIKAGIHNIGGMKLDKVREDLKNKGVRTTQAEDISNGKPKTYNVFNKIQNGENSKLLNNSGTTSIRQVVDASTFVEKKELEQTVKLTSATCFECGYKDRKDGCCGYSIITGKTQMLKDMGNGDKGCTHFIDRKEL